MSNGKHETKDAERAEMVRYLAEHGPTDGEQLTAVLGMAPSRFWALINHPWFEVTGRGWALTARGRAEGLGTPDP